MSKEIQIDNEKKAIVKYKYFPSPIMDKYFPKSPKTKNGSSLSFKHSSIVIFILGEIIILVLKSSILSKT